MDIDFGSVKSRKFAPVTDYEEGVYLLQIESWECKPPKDGDPDRGRNLNIKFSLPEIEVEEDLVPPVVWANIWTPRVDPWAAKMFFEALLNRELGEGDSIPDISDPDYWVGEKVRCNLVHERYTVNGQDRVKFVPSGPDAWLPAS